MCYTPASKLISPSVVIAKEPFEANERRAVISLASLYSFRMLGLFMVLPLLAAYTGEMAGATPLMIGLALGAYGLTQAALQIPLGWLSDRIGRVPVILGGLIVFAVGSAVAGSAEDVYGIITGRLLQGGGAIAAALMALAADYTREQQRTKAMAIIGGSIGLSFVVALVVGPMIASFGGLHLVFYCTAALAIAGLLIVLFALPPIPSAKTNDRAVKRAFLSQAVTTTGLPLVYLSVFLLHLLLMAVFVAVPERLSIELGIDVGEHWKFYLGSVVASLPGVLFLMKQKRSADTPKYVLMAAVFLVVVGQIIALNAANVWVLGGGLVIFFIGFNVMEASLPSLVSLIAPATLRGTALGVFSTGQFLGAFIGGTVGGAVFGWGGIHGLTILALSVAVIWLGLFIKWRPESSALDNY